MRAFWKGFVQNTFQRTGFKVTFNNATRNVYRDGVARLVVLDEKHGDLEILAFQRRPGDAKHIGSQEINVVQNPPASPTGKPTYRATLGTLYRGVKPGKKPHKFTLVGSL
jgi:hypothetical protein